MAHVVDCPFLVGHGWATQVVHVKQPINSLVLSDGPEEIHQSGSVIMAIHRLQPPGADQFFVLLNIYNYLRPLLQFILK
jgi:hypothetical protein